MSVLAFDVGGTKIAVARGQRERQVITLTDTKKLPVKSFGSFGEMVSGTGLGGVTHLAIGVAGPVVGRKVNMTNLPWTIDADDLEKKLGLPVTLVNDLEAYAQAISFIAPEHLVPLQGSISPLPHGTRALIAAGTGLGEALAVQIGVTADGIPSYKSVATEGGHCSFAPVSEEDRELLSFLQTRYQHVSWERVVSGLDGFRNIYDYLVTVCRLKPSQNLADAASQQHDIGAAVIAALDAGDTLAERIVRIFVRLYGCEAGNLALKCLPYGGVYIGGGIALRIEQYMHSREFTDGFSQKGRFSDLLRKIPIALVKDPDAALRGLVAIGST